MKDVSFAIEDCVSDRLRSPARERVRKCVRDRVERRVVNRVWDRVERHVWRIGLRIETTVTHEKR